MAMKFEGQSPPLLDNASQAMLAQTQLHYACYIGDGHMLDTLIGRALLHNNNDGDAMEACVAVMVSEEDAINGWTPAHWAAFYGQLTCLVKLNIKPHLGFDTPSHRSNVSPLHLAAKSGAILCLKWLLQCGASKNRQDFMGETALHKAAKSGNSDCAAMLVGHGASLSTKNHRGLTAADVAEQSNHSALAQYLRRAMEQSEYGSITQSDSPSLPISDLRNDPAYGGSGDTSHSIIMNGEEIYTSNCAKARNGIHADTEMEMEEESISEDQALSNNLENNQRLKFIGLKRSIDESGDFEHFHKRRCTVPSSRKDPSERYGDAHKNSVLSSYNAVLAMQVEPMSRPYCDKGVFEQDKRHDFSGESSAQSSMMEHSASLVAEQGYDSTLMSSMSNAFH